MLGVLEERNHGNIMEKKYSVLIKQMTKLLKLKLTSSSGWLIMAEQDPNPGHLKIYPVCQVGRQCVC